MVQTLPTSAVPPDEPDELGVALAIYSTTLEPGSITAALGCSPDASHLIGQRRGPKSPPYKNNAWFLMERHVEPFCVDDVVEALLARVPAIASAWSQLATNCEIQIRLTLHSSKGTDLLLAPRTIQTVADRSGTIIRDIYASPDDA